MLLDGIEVPAANRSHGSAACGAATPHASWCGYHPTGRAAVMQPAACAFLRRADEGPFSESARGWPLSFDDGGTYKRRYPIADAHEMPMPARQLFPLATHARGHHDISLPWMGCILHSARKHLRLHERQRGGCSEIDARAFTAAGVAGDLRSEVASIVPHILRPGQECPIWHKFRLAISLQLDRSAWRFG